MKRALALVAIAACGDNTTIEPDAAPPHCDPAVPNTICTVVGTGLQGVAGDGKPAIEAELYVPQDMAVAPTGELWVLDFNNYKVRKVLPDGTIQTMIGTGLVGDSPPPDVPAVPAQDALFNHTSDLFFHGDYLYLAAWHNSRIKRVRLDDMMLENFAGAGKRTFYYGDDGPALDAALDLPSSIALDPDGNIVIMDQANQVVRMVDQGGNIHRIVGTCIVDFDTPCGAGVSPVACSGSNKMACGTQEQLSDPDQLASICSLPCGPGYGGDGGPATQARLAQPLGQAADPAGRLTYDLDGNLLIADTENHRIRKVDRDGIITTIAGTGVAGYSGDDGPADAAQINHPIDIEVDAKNNIYFTDTFNHCIRKIDPSGTITRVAGVCHPASIGSFGGDGGPPLEALFDRPYGIELAGNRMFVADSYNNRIRVVNLPQ